MNNNKNPSIDVAIRDVLVHLVRQVPWGPSRSHLEKETASLRQKAIWERGMCDNHSTADYLHWEADLYQLAAEGRFPRENDQLVSRMAAQVAHALESECVKVADMDDDSEITRNSRVTAAVRKVLGGYDPEAKQNLENALRQKRQDKSNRQAPANFAYSVG